MILKDIVIKDEVYNGLQQISISRNMTIEEVINMCTENFLLGLKIVNLEYERGKRLGKYSDEELNEWKKK